MIHKRVIWSIFLVVALTAIVACSEQETLPPPTKVENESKPTVVENKEQQPNNDIVTKSDADKALATEMLKTIESYLKKQTTAELDAQLAETIESNIDLISEANRADFSNIAKHIRNGEKEEVVPLFAALMENYELGTVTVNNVEPKESNESPSPSSNVIASLDPNEVKKAIEDYAKEEWADDHKMQVYEIEEQTKAYNELIELSIDDDALKGILDYSYEEWDNDFRMVLYEFQEQLDALNQIKKLEIDGDEVKEKILANALSEWGTDYRMVLYEFNKQLEAHESLK